MGISLGNTSANAANILTNDSWSHTVEAGAKSIVVMIVMTNNTADRITAVTCGGQALTQETGSPRIHTAGADDSVISFWRLNNPPTGSQTIATTVGVGATTYRAVAASLITDGGAVEVDTSGGADTGAGTANSISVVLATTASRDTVCLFAFHAGEAALSSISTNLFNLLETDFGAQTGSFDEQDALGGNVTGTLTFSTDTAQGFGIAYGEAAGGAHNVSVTPATETDGPQALSVTKPIRKTLGITVEADVAQAISFTQAGPQFITLLSATETDAAQAVSFTKPIHKVLGPATESDAAHVLATGPVVVQEFAWTFG